MPATACKHADPKNPPNPTPAAPTGLVWNPTSTFLVPNQTPSKVATFIFSTEDGTIAVATSAPDAAVLAVDNSLGAVYKVWSGTVPNVTCSRPISCRTSAVSHHCPLARP